MVEDDEARADAVARAADDLVRAVLDDLAPTVAAYRREIGRRLDLDATEHLCLDLLRRLGPMPAGALADRAGVTRGGISKALRRLEEHGHVRRDASADHRQLVVAVLAEHPERDALVEEQHRLLRHEVQRLARTLRLDDPDRLAALTRWNALVLDNLQRRTRFLADRVVGQRRDAERRREDARRDEAWRDEVRRRE